LNEPTRIATTESVSLCTRMKKLTAFIELDSLRKKVADEKQQKGKMRSLEPIKP
jgi:hypothetical protein